MNYWLFKTEPNTYSIDDLANEPDQTTCWEGIRNYAARNHLRDGVKLGDQVLIYHSVVRPPSIVGVAEVVKEAYPDHFAFDPENPYYDAKSDKANPRWVMVDVKFVRKFSNPVSLDQVKVTEGLEEMVLVKISRLSIQPVTKAEWEIVNALGK